MKVITFSPTGGTKRVADLLAEAWQEENTQIDLTDSGADFSGISLSENDVALISVPSYGGRLPGTALERLGAISGGGAKAVLVCVYGNRAYDDTLVELRDAAKKAGFRIVAAVAALAEHSIARQIAAGRPDDADAQKLREFAARIRDKQSEAEPEIPGNPNYEPAVARPGMAPAAGDACVACGLCARKCPVQAIDRADVKKTDASKCISCMRCIAVCPKSARSLPEMMLAGAKALEAACAERKEPELYL